MLHTRDKHKLGEGMSVRYLLVSHLRCSKQRPGKAKLENMFKHKGLREHVQNQNSGTLPISGWTGSTDESIPECVLSRLGESGERDG